MHNIQNWSLEYLDTKEKICALRESEACKAAALRGKVWRERF